MKTLRTLSIAILSMIVFASCSKDSIESPTYEVKFQATPTATGIDLQVTSVSSSVNAGSSFQRRWQITKVNTLPNEPELPAITMIGDKVTVHEVWAKYYIQLSIIDQFGNSHAEYLTVTR